MDGIWSPPLLTLCESVAWKKEFPGRMDTGPMVRSAPPVFPREGKESEWRMDYRCPPFLPAPAYLCGGQNKLGGFGLFEELTSGQVGGVSFLSIERAISRSSSQSFQTAEVIDTLFFFHQPASSGRGSFNVL